MLAFFAHGWRSWKSAKPLALLAIGALAVGIGSTTAIYSIIHAVLLNPLPYKSPEHLISVYGTWKNRPGWTSTIGYLDSLDFAARQRTLDGFGCYDSGSFNITFNYQPVRVIGTEVSPSLPGLLGVEPALGRWFTANDGLHVAVLSANLWKRFGGQPDIIGKILTMNGRSYTVLGVMPGWYRLPAYQADNGLWVPLDPDPDQKTTRADNYLRCLARMKPGINLAQARDDMKRIAAELEKEHPVEETSRSAIAFPLLELMVQDIRPTLLLLLGAAGALLLITCANVAGLTLARSVGRARETAVRVAIGAARWQLALQYFTEGLLVSLAGAALGVVLSYSLDKIVVTLAADDLPRADETGVDWHVLVFALGLSVLCGVLFSLAPLWQAMRTPPNEVLSDGSRASAGARSRGLLRVFVVAEIALAFALLAVSVALAIQLGGLYRVDPGFDPQHLFTARMFVPPGKYSTEESRVEYESRIVEAIRRQPAITAAGFSSLLPLMGWGNNTTIEIEGQPEIDRTRAEPVEYRTISPSYFEAMRIPLLAGRYLNDRDAHHEVPGIMSIVFNRTAARMYWKGRDPVGSVVTLFGFEKARFRVVGVVGDTRNAGLGREVRPEMYVSYRESPTDQLAWIVRSSLDITSLTAELRQAVMRVDRDQPVYRVETMQGLLDESLGQARLQSFMVSFFAVAALLLSMLGVYGVVSYAVRQRTTEIGTRMAIGATSRDLIRLVIGDGLKMTAIGVAVGLAAAVAVFTFTRALKFSGDVRPFLIPAALLALLTALACLFPAWRATLVSPLIAIRNEPGSLWQQTRWGFLRVADRIGSLASRVIDDQSASSESELLAEVAEAGRRANSFGEAMQAALALVRERIHAESLAVLVQKQAGQPYRCAAIVPDSCGDGWILPADALIVGRLRNYSGALPVNAGDLDAAARWSPAELPEIAVMRDLGVALAVRIAVKNDTSGVLFAGPPVGRTAYSGLEKRLVRGVAAQLAMMIENSRLTERIVEQERLRRELMLASEVQKRLFPENSPETASLQLAGVCVPARGVGGDYYDFLDLGGRRMGIALADVAGKGIAAALIMSVVQASMRSLAGAEGVSLAEIASKMNRLLHRSTGSNSYATFFYAQVDEDKRQMRYVNAGHNPPFLLRNGETHSGVPFVASTAPIEELSTGGTIIGMFAQSSYEEAILDLHSGDILMAFTDGVTEALNPQEEEFGEDRLKDALRAASHLPVNEMAARILQELKTWIADAAQYDDLTFIVMKVN